MREAFASVLLMGLALSRFCQRIQFVVLDTQKIHFNLGLLPGASGNFTVMRNQHYPCILSSNITVAVSLMEYNYYGTSKISQVLNQVYFTAVYHPFSGSLPWYRRRV